jgi:UDP-glucose 4-epimerase
VLDDFSTGLRSNLDELDVTVVAASLTDAPRVADAASGVDTIVHLGARGSVPRSMANPRATHDVNTTGTLNVLEAVRATRAHVVFSSSSSVYGSNTTLPKTEDLWTAPMTPYAASKAAAEGYVSAYAAAYGLDATCFRFFNVFGPWQRPDHDYAAVIPRWIWAALHGRPITVNGDGSVTRDFTYVDEVVDILEETVTSRLTHGLPVNLAFGRQVSLQDVITQLEATVGEVDVVYGPERLGDIPRSENDPALLTSLFPEVQQRPFEESLAATVQWLREYGGRVCDGPPVGD